MTKTANSAHNIIIHMIFPMTKKNHKNINMILIMHVNLVSFSQSYTTGRIDRFLFKLHLLSWTVLPNYTKWSNNYLFFRFM